MDEPLDRHEYLELIQAQETYESPIESGQYLGFYIPGDRVILNKIENFRKIETAPLISCNVRKLFKK